MKKIYFLLCLLSVLVVLNTSAQRQTATFDDGTKVDYEILTNKYKDSHHFSIYLGGNTLSTIYSYYLGASYRSDKFLINTNVNPFGYDTPKSFNVNGVLFLKEFEKEKDSRLRVKSEYTGSNTKTVYYIKSKMIKSTYIGPHLGYSAGFKLASDDDSTFFTQNEIAIGVAIVFGRHTKYVVIDKGNSPTKFMGTGQFATYLDLLYFTPSHNNSSIGGRLYFNAKNSFVGTRDFGFAYGLGVGTDPFSEIYPIFAFGFYGGF